jgi:hypothetical protein
VKCVLRKLQKNRAQAGAGEGQKEEGGGAVDLRVIYSIISLKVIYAIDLDYLICISSIDYLMPDRSIVIRM